MSVTDNNIIIKSTVNHHKSRQYIYYQDMGRLSVRIEMITYIIIQTQC